ncbi:hypothetical protein KIN20_031328 [Parelaphostrongylus tenuis]|uniref:Uncharacterized protein n=1 Tax=Parelaphostrongylus tenuis TaxID=148309 RepID=A0AAD5WH67_PARTN|nr:hypothetical protein KIN20_031328 [Parelaphostrongylus tenuis]
MGVMASLHPAIQSCTPARDHLRQYPPQPTTDYDGQRFLLHMAIYANETHPLPLKARLTCVHHSRCPH